jgi:hypothetical protein
VGDLAGPSDARGLDNVKVEVSRVAASVFPSTTRLSPRQPE